MWLRRHVPGVERREVPSTAVAATQAASLRNAAAIGSRRAARIHGLDILAYPIEQGVPNVTQLVALARRCRPLPSCSGTGRCGTSPIPGRPSEYAFFVDLEGVQGTGKTQLAMDAAAATGAQIRVLGAYPIRPYHVG